MTAYILGRLAATVPVLLGVSLLVFSMIYLLPGDPVQLMLSEMGGAASTRVTPEMYDNLRRELGLNEPFPIHYLKFLSRAVQGDLGRS
jgi:peptide/nickel transport system permease protein